MACQAFVLLRGRCRIGDGVEHFLGRRCLETGGSGRGSANCCKLRKLPSWIKKCGDKIATLSPIDTSQARDRRVLHFDRIDDVLADVEALATSEREGNLQRLGNWTFGQTLGHLATWIDYSYDGAPLRIPFFGRWMMRPMKRRFLYKPMPAGRNIPKVPGGTLATDLVSSEEGLAHFRQSFGRLKGESPARPHMLFGPLTHDEWINQHLRHAELHLSFLRADLRVDEPRPR